ncbi:MAG: glucose 1-dehydrogenase, partial [Planctomycetota bacterium]
RRFTMRAFAVVPETGKAEVVGADEPGLTGPTDVKLRVLDVGICGTDREIAAGEYGTPPEGDDRLIIGHESVAQVVEVGAGVERLSAGDLVVPSVRRPCPHAYCTACQNDQQDFCYTGDFTERGIKERHGFLAEYIVDEPQYLTKLTPELRDVGVLIEPLTIAEKALTQIWGVQQRLPWACAIDPTSRPSQGCNALVLGAGPVGLLGAMALAESGFRTHVYSREPAGGPRSQLVESFGGRYLSSADHAVDDLPTTMGGIDVVYEATGASKLAFDVLEELGTNGVYVFTGVPGRKHPFEVNGAKIMRNLVLKNQVVFGTVNAGSEAFESAVDRLGRFMTRWPDAVRGLITRRWPLEEVDRLLNDPGPGIKHVVALAE